MANVRDYVHWRGDLTFDERPFCDVDNIAVNALSYIDLTGVLGNQYEDPEGVSLAELSRRARQQHSSLDPRRLVFVPGDLLHDLGSSDRFASCRVLMHEDRTDAEAGIQFAALALALPDGSTYVAFRGTDTSIVGWREDFVMSFAPMPSHPLAVEFLHRMTTQTVGPIRVGGHSKGGNLAVWAAAHLTDDALQRVTAVYSNDGPGLSGELLEPAQLDRVSNRIVRIVPEFSVVGQLFQRDEPHLVVASTARGIAQHDLMTWCVGADALIAAAAIAPRARTINAGIDGWLEQARPADRRAFTDALFDSLSVGGAVLIQDVPHSDFGGVEAVLLSLVRTRGQTRQPRRLVLKATVDALRAIDYRNLFRSYALVRFAALTALGVFFILVPRLAVQVIGAIALVGVCAFLAVRLLRFVLRFRGAQGVGWVHAAIALVAIAVAIGIATQVSAFVIPENLLFGVLFISSGWRAATAAVSTVRSQPRQHVRAALFSVATVLSVLFGVVALSTVGRVLPFFVLQAGHYCLLAGLIGMFLVIKDDAARIARTS